MNWDTDAGVGPFSEDAVLHYARGRDDREYTITEFTIEDTRMISLTLDRDDETLFHSPHTNLIDAKNEAEKWDGMDLEECGRGSGDWMLEGGSVMTTHPAGEVPVPPQSPRPRSAYRLTAHPNRASMSRPTSVIGDFVAGDN